MLFLSVITALMLNLKTQILSSGVFYFEDTKHNDLTLALTELPPYPCKNPDACSTNNTKCLGYKMNRSVYYLV